MLTETKPSYDFRGHVITKRQAESAIMKTPIRGEFLIHVDVPTIMANREKNDHQAVIRVRSLSNLEDCMEMRELAWDGATRFVHHNFMKIPGTEIQNWIETDCPLTCVQDGRPLSVLSPHGQRARPMTDHIQGKWVIHIAAPVLLKNRAEGTDNPVIAIRSAASDWSKDVIFARKVEWHGPTRMVHRPTTPIPGTNGRGISFVETDAPLTVYVDGRAPIVLFDWPREQAAA